MLSLGRQLRLASTMRLRSVRHRRLKHARINEFAAKGFEATQRAWPALWR
jgi:hypothetical protein